MYTWTHVFRPFLPWITSLAQSGRAVWLGTGVAISVRQSAGPRAVERSLCARALGFVAYFACGPLGSSLILCVRCGSSGLISSRLFGSHLVSSRLVSCFWLKCFKTTQRRVRARCVTRVRACRVWRGVLSFSISFFLAATCVWSWTERLTSPARRPRSPRGQRQPPPLPSSRRRASALRFRGPTQAKSARS